MDLHEQIAALFADDALDTLIQVIDLGMLEWGASSEVIHQIRVSDTETHFENARMGRVI